MPVLLKVLRHPLTHRVALAVVLAVVTVLQRRNHGGHRRTRWGRRTPRRPRLFLRLIRVCGARRKTAATVGPLVRAPRTRRPLWALDTNEDPGRSPYPWASAWAPATRRRFT